MGHSHEQIVFLTAEVKHQLQQVSDTSGAAHLTLWSLLDFHCFRDAELCLLLCPSPTYTSTSHGAPVHACRVWEDDGRLPGVHAAPQLPAEVLCRLVF